VSAYQIPLPDSQADIHVEGPFPLSETDWDYFMALLEAMKPGLTENSGVKP
jgi:hypothetical protein